MLEGVGSGSALGGALITVLAWVEVPYDLRMARGLERGGVGVAGTGAQWAVDEQELFTRERTRERADVVLDGAGRLPAPLSLVEPTRVGGAVARWSDGPTYLRS